MKFKVDLSKFSGEELDFLEGLINSYKDQTKYDDPEVNQILDVLGFSVSDEMDRRERKEPAMGFKSYNFPDKENCSPQTLSLVAGWACSLVHGQMHYQQFGGAIIAALMYEDSHWNRIP